MSGLNRAQLIGNLGADPEIWHTQNGNPVGNLRLATTERWTDKNTGEKKEKTEWHRVVIFSEPLCAIAEQYLRKGSKVFIEGQIQTRKWTDQHGADKYTTEIVLQRFGSTLVMLDGVNQSQQGGQQQSAPAQIQTAPAQPAQPAAPAQPQTPYGDIPF